MTRQEQDELTMRHLERAYRACHATDSKARNAMTGESPLSEAILEAISLLARTSDIKRASRSRWTTI